MKMMRPAAALSFLAIAAVSSFPALADCESSGSVEYLCGLQGPEDLVSVPDSRWLVATGMGEQGSGGKLYLIDTKARSSSMIYPRAGLRVEHDKKTYGACPGPLSDSVFSGHGIDLRKGAKGRHTVYVINHAGRESVEVFTIDASQQSPTLTWVGCVIYPSGTSGNGVAALPDGALATTNFRDPADKDAFQKMSRGEITGNVLEWHPQKGWTTVPGSALSGPNGIVTSPDGKWLFVASWPAKQVIRFSRTDPAAKKLVIETQFLTDNLRWTADGSIIATGHEIDISKLFACRPPECYVTTAVAKIDPQAGRSSTLLRLPGNGHFAGGTTAIQIDDRFWIGSFRGDRIALVPAAR